MTLDQARNRLDLAARTVEGLETRGMSGAASDWIRMLATEIQLLDGIAADHPTLDEAARGVIRRYQQMLLRAKLGV